MKNRLKFSTIFMALLSLCLPFVLSQSYASCVYNGLKCENPPYYRIYEQSCTGYACPKYSTSENCDTVFGSLEEACDKDE